MSKKVIVVGGTGFLGYHAVKELLTQGWEVTALGLPSSRPVELFPDAVKLILRNIDVIPETSLPFFPAGQCKVLRACSAAGQTRWHPAGGCAWFLLRPLRPPLAATQAG